MLNEKFLPNLGSMMDGYAIGVSGGVNSALESDMITRDCCAMAINTSFRQGKPRSRSAYEQVAWTGTGPFAQDLFQGAINFYQLKLGKSVLIAAYGGRIYKVDPETNEVIELTTTDLNDPVARHYFCQVEEYLVIQDGTHVPFIWDGNILRRAHSFPNNPYIIITSLTQVNGVATAVTSTPHGFVLGDMVLIQNITPIGYEAGGSGAYIKPVDDFTFTFLCDSSLASPATPGNIIYPYPFNNSMVCQYMPEVPTGLIMAYGQGRLFVTNPDRIELFAGDIVAGDAGTDYWAGQNTINALRFTETTHAAEGGSFRLPASMGRINALSFISQGDTTNGQGQLYMFGEYGTSSLDISLPRLQWKDNPVQNIVFTTEGATSHNSVTGVNGDLLYRSFVGIRTLRNARADLSTFGQTPVSAEVMRILDNDEPTSLGYVSSVNFDNHTFTTCTPRYDTRKAKIVQVVEEFQMPGYTSILVTTNVAHSLKNGDKVNVNDHDIIQNGSYTVFKTPTPFTFTISIGVNLNPVSNSQDGYIWGDAVGAQIYHRGMVVRDYTPVSSSKAQSAPIWNGVWTGLNVQQLVTGYFFGVQKCYMFVWNDKTQLNELWELTNHQGYDKGLDGAETPVEWILESRSFDFQKPIGLKSLYRASLWLKDIYNTVDIKLQYREDASYCWQDWTPEFERCSPVGTLVNETNANVVDFVQDLPNGRNRINFGIPDNVCDDVTNMYTRVGYLYQFRITIKGRCTLSKFVMSAREEIESTWALCAAGGGGSK